MHTQEVLSALRGSYQDLKEIQTSWRGFVITGDEEFLGPGREARRKLPALLQRLHTLTADNPPQQKRMDRLASLTKGIFGLSDEIETARRGVGFEAARK